VVYGKERMMDIMTNYNTPVIAQNMFHEEDGKELFPPYWTKEIEGVKIGFIGINDPDVPVRQNPIFSEGMTFSGIEDEVKELITKVKKEEEVDVLFLVTHIGVFKQVDLANQELAKDVDYILGNDTHERVRELIHGKYAKGNRAGSFWFFRWKANLAFCRWKTGRR
jgi:S-sulfosulfanyl-L-cysteine sulfohydrolase